MTKTTRFSGADWADQFKDIILIGVGGIGSWVALNLARIGHSLYLVDPDIVDETNVLGGQMYRNQDISKAKVEAVANLCREMGCTNPIDIIQDSYTTEIGMTDVCITGLDNMLARRQVFESWVEHIKTKEESERAKCLFIDGRLTMELFEIFAFSGNDQEAIEKYKNDHLFSDEESPELDCTTKQSTWCAMGIASFITATLCNWLTNIKLEANFREVPFYQRMYFPIIKMNKLVKNDEVTIL